MRSNFLKSVLAFALAFSFFTHAAAASCESERASGTFIVSGVLKRDGADVTIKLVQGLIRANAEQEALAKFKQSTAADYPGYQLLDSLAMGLNLRSNSCPMNFRPGRELSI